MKTDNDIIRQLLIIAYEKYATGFLSKYGQEVIDMNIRKLNNNEIIGIQFTRIKPYFIYETINNPLKIPFENVVYSFYANKELIKYKRTLAVKELLNGK
jgi:hypothetical protein